MKDKKQPEFQAPTADADHAERQTAMGASKIDYGHSGSGIGYTEPGTEGAEAIKCLEAQGAISSSETNSEGPTGA